MNYTNYLYFLIACKYFHFIKKWSTYRFYQLEINSLFIQITINHLIVVEKRLWKFLKCLFYVWLTKWGLLNLQAPRYKSDLVFVFGKGFHSQLKRSSQNGF
jgi:hypothetical protein